MVKTKKDILSTRIDVHLKDALNQVSKHFSLSVSDIITQALIDYFEKVDIINGKIGELSLSSYMKVVKEEFNADIVRKERNRIISKNLFMTRVKKDVFKMIYYKVPSNNIKKLLDVYEKELYTYNNFSDIVEEFNKIKNMNETELKQIEKMLQDTDNYLHINFISKEEKKNDITGKDNKEQGILV